MFIFPMWFFSLKKNEFKKMNGYRSFSFQKKKKANVMSVDKRSSDYKIIDLGLKKK